MPRTTRKKPAPPAQAPEPAPQIEPVIPSPASSASAVAATSSAAPAAVLAPIKKAGSFCFPGEAEASVGLVTYSIANRKAAALIPALKAKLPAGALDDADRVHLLASVSALVSRHRNHRDDPERLLQDAMHEVDKMAFANPTASTNAHVRALAACDWDHATAIIEVIRARLPDASRKGRRNLDKKTIAKARLPPKPNHR